MDLENEPSWVEESWLIQPRQRRESSKGLEALRHPSRPAAMDQVVADDREEYSLVRQAGREFDIQMCMLETNSYE